MMKAGDEMKRIFQLCKDRLKKGELVKRTAALIIAVVMMTTFSLSVSAGKGTAPASGNSAYDMRTSKRSSTTAGSANATTTSTTTTTTTTEATTTTTTAPTGSELNENAVDDAVQTATELNEDGTPKINAGSAIVMDCDTGMVLYGVNENQQMPMASTTKIMTCILALESGDIGRTITVTDECMRLLDGTKIGLQPGYKITMHDLCVAMMMYSGNDAANTAAVAVSGSIEAFVSLMNEKATQLGMLNTHFDTPSGLDQFSDGAHYSTAYDMALLGKYAMQNEDFRSIVAFRVRSIYYDEFPFPKGRNLVTHNYLLQGQRFGYEGCDGIKTGVTNLAGQCLVSHVSSKEGLHLVCVTLNNLNRWNDHKTLYNYAKSLYEQVEVDPDITSFDATVVGGNRKRVHVDCKPGATCNVLKTQKKDLVREVVFDQFIYAPIKTGEVVGHLRYSVNGIVIADYPITATEDVRAVTNGWFTDYIRAIEERERLQEKEKNNG